MKCFHVFLLLVCSVLDPSGKAIAKEIDSSKACSRQYVGRNVCRISMLSLIGSPGEYIGERLGFIAYLAVHRGALTLFPAENNFKISDDMSSVELMGQHQKLQDICNKWCYGYVVVRGRFSLGDSLKTSGGRLGILTDFEITPTYTSPINKKSREVMIRIDLDEEIEEEQNHGN